MNDSTALVPLAETMQLGGVLAKSGFFEDSRQEAQAVVKVLAGRELGIGPVAAMTGIHIIKGKPSIGANVMAGVIKASRRYTYRVKALDANACVIEFFERNGDKWESIGISSMTIQEARQAGTQNLDRFPRNMLFARAMSNGARWYCPDVFGGAPVYTPEEMGAPVDEDGNVIEGTYHNVAEQKQDAPATPTVSAPSPAQTTPRTNGESKPRLAVIRTPQFPQYAQKFCEQFPRYQGKTGGVDGPHVLAAAAKCGYSEITADNIEAVFTALRQHAEEQAQLPA